MGRRTGSKAANQATTDTPVSSAGSPGLKSQREFREKQGGDGLDFSLIVAGAFVRGIRDIGYKSTGTALDELIDNSIQAEASNVHIIYGYSATSDAKPDKIAIIDNGHGMDPEMIRFSVLWGGTHRENDRTGFGRYGYGLPSACVSQGKKFSVFSIPEDGTLHKVTVDVDDIGAGKYTTPEGRVLAPEATPAELPAWVATQVQEKLGGLKHGTVVIIEKADRLSWKTRNGLNEHLTDHFGLIYRNYLRKTTIYLDGQKIEPLDPLFITPGYRYYELPGDPDRAKALAPMQIEVKDRETGKPVGTLKLRFSFMPPSFTRPADNKLSEKGRGPRLYVRKENNGIIVLRKGRQIDVIDSRCPWTTFVNYDRYFGIEVDFPPTLDEEFSITTAKQQIGLSDRIWEILREAGVYKVIEGLRKDIKTAFSTDRTAREDDKKKRASEQAMEEAQKFKTTKSGEESVEQQKKSQEQFHQEVKERAESSGMPTEQVERELLSETKNRPYIVKEVDYPGAPFFDIKQFGGQRVLQLNRGHRYYTDVYAGPDSTPRLRAALEVLLFVLGDCELDATGERRTFYEMERGEWSKRLTATLEKLNQVFDVDDEASAGSIAKESSE